MRRLLSLSFSFLLLFDAAGTHAQRPQRRGAVRPDTPSVVMVPKSQQQVVDTALLLPEEPRRRRKFRVMVVPAPPPGRTRQDILYSDSLGRQRP